MGKEQELLEAARRGQVPIIEKILSPRHKWQTSITLPLPPFAVTTLRKGVNANCQDTNGETPLHLAALNEHIEVVETLLRLQASANIPDQKGCFPLHLAAWKGNSEICRTLLTHGPSLAKVNEQNCEGESALHSAAQYGHTRVVQVLLQYNADVELQNIRGETPLDLAVKYGRLEAVQLLLSSTSRDPWNQHHHLSSTTPLLLLAARNGHRNIVEALLAAGYSINIRTRDGSSALHEAAKYERLDIAKFLLEKGIDTTLVDSQSKTAQDILIAQNTKKSEEILYLIKAHIHNVEDSTVYVDTAIESEYDTVPTARPVRISSCRTSNGSHLTLPYNNVSNSVGSGDSSVFESFSNSDDNLSTRAVVDLDSLYDKLPASRALQDASGAELNVQNQLQPSHSPETPKKPPRKKAQAAAASKAAALISPAGVEMKVEGDKTAAVACGNIDASQRIDAAASCESGLISTRDGENTTGVHKNTLDNRLSNCTLNNNNNYEGKEDKGESDRVPNVTTSGVVDNAFNHNNNGSHADDSDLLRLIDDSLANNQLNNRRDNNQSNCEAEAVTLKPICRPPSLELVTSNSSNNCIAPTSPTGYDQPPTPEHPPPSPSIAVLDIQGRINPLERRRSRDIETITESEYLMTSSQGHASAAAADPTSLSHIPVPVGSGSRSRLESGPVSRSESGKQPSADGVTQQRVEKQEEEIFVIDSHKYAGLGFGSSMGKKREKKVRSALLDRIHSSLSGASSKRGSGPGPDSDGSYSERSSAGCEGQQRLSPDGEEWKMDDLISSIGGGLDADLLVKEFDEKLSAVHQLSNRKILLSVGDWLKRLKMSNYENTFNTHGFDDADYLCPDILGKEELIEMGIEDENHRAVILTAVSQFEPVPLINCETVSEWLRSLRLFDYMDIFLKREITLISQLKDCSEACLCSILLDVAVVGHRRRMEISLRKILGNNSQMSSVQEHSADVHDRRCHYEQLIRSCCRFTVKYLGSTMVASLDGTDSTKASISRLKKSVNTMSQVPSIVLSISCDGVKFFDANTEEVIGEHEISNIFCVCQDGEELNYLAYITRDLRTEQHYCHVFSAPSTQCATDLILTLGDAFEIAYQMALEENRLNSASASALPSFHSNKNNV